MLVGAVLLWDILFRGQLGFSVSFLEEMYARNLGNLLISPLRATEFVAALMIMSIIRLAIGMVPVTLLGDLVFRLQSLGARLRAGGVLRQPDADQLGGRHLRLRAGAAERARRRDVRLEHHVPLPAAHLRLLPGRSAALLVQAVAWTLPPTYVFEGMRALVIDQTFRADLMIQALALNAGAVCGGDLRLPRPARLGPPQRLAAADWRIIHQLSASFPHANRDLGGLPG